MVMAARADEFCLVSYSEQILNLQPKRKILKKGEHWFNMLVLSTGRNAQLKYWNWYLEKIVGLLHLKLNYL